MHGNEILLNLMNHEHLANSELIAGLLELSNHDRDSEYNWHVHPVVRNCFKDLEQRMGRLTSKHVFLTAQALDRLRFCEAEVW